MATKSPPKRRKKTAAKEQYQRFLAVARESGASKDAKDLERAVKKVAPAK